MPKAAAMHRRALGGPAGFIRTFGRPGGQVVRWSGSQVVRWSGGQAAGPGAGEKPPDAVRCNASKGRKQPAAEGRDTGNNRKQPAAERHKARNDRERPAAEECKTAQGKKWPTAERRDAVFAVRLRLYIRRRDPRPQCRKSPRPQCRKILKRYGFRFLDKETSVPKNRIP